MTPASRTASGLPAVILNTAPLKARVVQRRYRLQPPALQCQSRALQPVQSEGIFLIEDGNAGDPQILGEPRHHLVGFLVVRCPDVEHIVQLRVTQELGPGERSQEGHAGISKKDNG